MAEENVKFTALNLGTAIMIVTMIAGLAGTWSVMGERIANNVQEIQEIQAHVRSIDMRLVEAERENATTEIRLDNLRETLADLRARKP